MLIKKPSDIQPSEITPEHIYRRRREFMRDGAMLAGGAMLSPLAFGQQGDALKAAAPPGLTRTPPAAWWEGKFDNIKPAPSAEPLYTAESLTPYQDVTRYNNFYEFGMDKSDPYNRSSAFQTEPWSIEISGEVDKPGTYHLEDILKPHDLEERSLPPALCRGLVDGDSLDRFPPGGPDQALRAQFPGAICRV